MNPAINASDNRLSSGQGYTFDNAGNTTRDAGDRKFTYDAENKQVKVESLSPGTDTVTGTIGEYFYDGDGRRVKKYVPSTGETTVFVYDAAGKQIAEYSTIVETTEPRSHTSPTTISARPASTPMQTEQSPLATTIILSGRRSRPRNEPWGLATPRTR